MGQDTGVTASYFKPTVQELLEEYLKAVENLTINKSASQQQIEMIKNQQALAIEMQTKDQQISELKERMDKMQQVTELNYKSYDDLVEEIFGKAKRHIAEKDHEIHRLEEQMNKMNVVMNNLSSGLQLYRKEFELYREQYGSRSLTEGERKKIGEAKEQLKNMLDDG